MEAPVSEIYWLVSIAAIVGVWLNVQKRVACFYIWGVTNAIWTYAEVTRERKEARDAE